MGRLDSRPFLCIIRYFVYNISLKYLQKMVYVKGTLYILHGIIICVFMHLYDHLPVSQMLLMISSEIAGTEYFTDWTMSKN